MSECREKPKPGYCSKCGKRLIEIECKDFSEHDVRTGKILHDWWCQWKCPNRKWPWDGHDKTDNYRYGDQF